MTVWELEQDFFTLVGLTEELPAASQRRAQILRALDRAVDVDRPRRRGRHGRRRPAPCSHRCWPAPAAASAHRVHAVGHAHIDSAWLWPIRETVRKVARTFSNVCDLIEQSRGLRVRRLLGAAVRLAEGVLPRPVRAGEARTSPPGRFVPVGGMWVESDTNMPGGEALARQFVAGKRFFLEEFGVETEEVWLPDSFGYSAALPQIVAAPGSRWFLTQKISWNETNVMPHHTFRWEGIDGTRIFTHFPPVDTYNSELSAADLARAERQYRREGRRHARRWCPSASATAAAGRPGRCWRRPSARPISRARRRSRCPARARFFTDAEAEYPHPPVWSGELYLEFHRGTYTSQARTKQGNRRSEHLLREAELWATTAAVRAGARLPVEALTQALADGAAAAVPRHPARHVDRLGAPGGRAELRARWRRRWRG